MLILGSGESSDGVRSRDILLRPYEVSELTRINEKHQAYDALSYALLFPAGDKGWCVGTNSRSQEKVSIRKYYRYRLMFRDGRHCLHLYGKLFQQYIIDMYAKVEQERLNYIRHNQSKMRAELYNGLQDALFSGGRDITTVGRKIILPSSFIGDSTGTGGLIRHESRHSMERERGEISRISEKPL